MKEKINRRNFLKLTGLGALGLATGCAERIGINLSSSANADAKAEAEAKAEVAPIQAPEATEKATPTAEVIATPTKTKETTYDYVPGGPNYAWPETGVEQLEDRWTRIRQAANGQFLPWTFLTRIGCDREPLDAQLQWDSATKLMIFGEIECKIELRRDLESADLVSPDPDPYDVANAKNSPLGLGLFISGVGEVIVNDGDPVELKGPGVKQLNFPKDWEGIWKIELKVPENGVVVLNQGERITPNDNWPLP